jgi:hypothetical protein
LVDACYRAMGLATPPPPADSTELWAAMWLDRLLADAARGEPATDVRTAAWTHPAVELFAAHEPGLTDAAVARLARLGHLMGRAKPWPDLRQRARRGRVDGRRHVRPLAAGDLPGGRGPGRRARPPAPGTGLPDGAGDVGRVEIA